MQNAKQIQPPCRLLYIILVAVASVHLCAAGSLISWAAQVSVDEGCDRELMVVLHRRLEPAVRKAVEVHFNFTSGRHYEVVEIISVFQADRICRSALNVMESLRLTLSFLVCPSRFAHLKGVLPDALRLSANVFSFFASVRYIARAGAAADEAHKAVWNKAADEMVAVSGRLEEWVAKAIDDGNRVYVGIYARLEPLVVRMLDTISDFLRSLVEDMSTLFLAPNYVAQEMMPELPVAKKIALENYQSRTSPVDIFYKTEGGQALSPVFLSMLNKPIGPLSQPDFFPTHQECGSIPMSKSLQGVSLEFQDEPFAHTDVTGAHLRQPSPLQLLQSVARHTRLSNLYISIQITSNLIGGFKCGSELTLYDPSYCLLDQHWGGYTFQLNPLPPYNLTVVYAGKATGPGAWLAPTDVHSIHVEKRDMQWSSLVSIFKSINHHSPDLLYLSPLVGNCVLLDRLLGSGTVKPKFVYLPINPLVPPPLEDMPDYSDWWLEHTEKFLNQLINGMASGNSEESPQLPITMSMWLGQCSLAASARLLGHRGYAILHVEHTYAVFVWGPLEASVISNTLSEKGEDLRVGPAGSSHGSASAGKWVESATMRDENLRLAWLQGWKCSPMAPYLFDIEPLRDLVINASAFESLDEGSTIADAEASGLPPGPITRLAGRRLAAKIVPEAPLLRYFLERGKGRDQKGRCVEGSCDCFPPYRGPLCQYEDLPQQPQKLRAVIHYITADTEKDLEDIRLSLTSLWTSFNQHYDYPVVVFHDGLPLKTRKNIVDASENRVWLVYLPNFHAVPAEWSQAASESARDFSVGYRAMIRWRSGPVFLEPALAQFDYAMTLDTDSYFPNKVGADPFEFVHQEGLIAAFPHLGRESASVVVNFMHYFLIYCRLKDLNPHRTEMISALIEKNYKWYQQCMMLDIEILRLDWFRSEQYQDFFNYMDSTGGFWIHRWGNNPFRTFAVTLMLKDSDVRALNMPFAHQDYCSCGAGGPACTWDTTTKAFRCLEKSTSVSVRLAATPLSEGLLDLQPWRGTERQKRKFEPNSVHQFVAEHMPF